MKKLRPCDCRTLCEVFMLDTYKMEIENVSIDIVFDGDVILSSGITMINVPMATFKSFAEWYLTPQEIEE